MGIILIFLAIIGIGIGAVFVGIFSVANSVIDAMPAVFGVLLILFIIGLFFATIEAIFPRLFNVLSVIGKAICYICFVPPIAVILFTICAMPFMLITALTDSLAIGIISFIVMASLIGFAMFNRKKA